MQCDISSRYYTEQLLLKDSFQSYICTLSSICRPHKLRKKGLHSALKSEKKDAKKNLKNVQFDQKSTVCFKDQYQYIFYFVWKFFKLHLLGILTTVTYVSILTNKKTTTIGNAYAETIC